MRSITLLASLFLISCTPEDTNSTQSENPAKALVQESIKAHGGIDKWYDNGLLHFRWTYNMRDKGVTLDTTQTVDPKSLSTVHKVQGSDTTFGMNKGVAWIKPADAKFMVPPKFWSLTPIYLFGIPFVFNDENANFEQLRASMHFEGKDYTQVKITYNAGAGDSSDDYYVLLIDPETKITRGAYYTVTNPLVLNGKAPGPAKFITLDNLTDIEGVKLASGHRTFKLEGGEIGEIMRDTEVDDVKFLKRGSIDLSIPSDAKKL